MGYKHVHKTPQSNRSRMLRCRVGIDENDYLKMLKEQHGLCAICANPPTTRAFDVDHDHRTNKVRGLLCSSCNRGIGYLQDNVALLERAAEYLYYYSAKNCAHYKALGQ